MTSILLQALNCKRKKGYKWGDYTNKLVGRSLTQSKYPALEGPR